MLVNSMPNMLVPLFQPKNINSYNRKKMHKKGVHEVVSSASFIIAQATHRVVKK